MAEAAACWLVSPLIKIVVDKAKFCASDRLKWLSGGVPEALNQLNKTLTEFRTVAGAVERSRGPRGSNLDCWLQQLKDAVHDADDVVDEFHYRTLLQPEGKVSRARSNAIKLGKQLVGNDESLNRLKGVIKKLDSIKTSNGQLMQAAELEARTSGELSCHLTSDGSVTGALPDEDGEMFGRDAERKDMVSWLLEDIPPDGADRCATDATFSVAAIIGLGGMGKTTLVRALLDDKLVKEKFKKILWVCPAGTYDKVGLLKQILHSAGEEIRNDNFNWLQNRLKEVVSSHRFLLILDNVWDKEMDDLTYRDIWSAILVPLRCGQTGSKIVVTTRKNIVADLLDASKRVPLNGLAPVDVWLLFKKNAFGNDNIDKEYPALQAIGKQLVTKLKGLPLAAKVVGRMLQSKWSTREWKEIQEMEIYGSVSSTLDLCYRNLPEHLQPCFAICSIFPKNWRFKRDKLIKIWMALDFIQPVDNKQLEDVGKKYFNQLVERSFFHERKEGRRCYHYIHDLMHDLAENVSRNDCARLESVEKKKVVICQINGLWITHN